VQWYDNLKIYIEKLVGQEVGTKCKNVNVNRESTGKESAERQYIPPTPFLFKIEGFDADSGRHTQNRREKVVDLKIELNPGEGRIREQSA